MNKYFSLVKLVIFFKILVFLINGFNHKIVYKFKYTYQKVGNL